MATRDSSTSRLVVILRRGKPPAWSNGQVANVVPETLPSYTFTGQHLLLDDGDGHWRIKFLSSGVLEWLSPDTVIDLFLVGAGGAGGHIRGGGGGYTQTYKQITIKRENTNHRGRRREWDVRWRRKHDI